MNKKKTELTILKILYIVLFVLALLLIINYESLSKNKEMKNTFSYEILDIVETNTTATYKIELDKEYSKEILEKIVYRMEQDYIKIYDLNSVTDKVEDFIIEFYINDELYIIHQNEEFLNKEGD